MIQTQTVGFSKGQIKLADIDEDGNVFINGELLDEPYLAEKAFGDCNIELPYQVPESRIFCI